MALYKNLNDYEVLYMIKEKDEVAEDLILDKYSPIIKQMASKYKKQAKKCGLEIEDLYQEGYIGLMNAVENYDMNGGSMFYTYALISIKSKMQNYLKRQYTNKHMILNQGISLHQSINNDMNSELIELIENPKADKPEELFLEKDLERKVKEFLFSLEFPESLILELFINGFKLNDISELLDISLKKVRNDALRVRKKLALYLKSN